MQSQPVKGLQIGGERVQLGKQTKKEIVECYNKLSEMTEAKPNWSKVTKQETQRWMTNQLPTDFVKNRLWKKALLNATSMKLKGKMVLMEKCWQKMDILRNWQMQRQQNGQIKGCSQNTQKKGDQYCLVRIYENNNLNLAIKCLLWQTLTQAKQSKKQNSKQNTGAKM
ncbi:hypothetical protein OXYTRIMIC_401 [Oxytricha trifallax]|uniref:Uncharacterized protein n=1 Tax=Oxytricha trifallax TaxID=1172189 RepID=A0A073I094_9SPIT|nr:hypothetical protein OXYTRIMIC_401 [Oxytricha trifallax]